MIFVTGLSLLMGGVFFAAFNPKTPSRWIKRWITGMMVLGLYLMAGSLTFALISLALRYLP